MSPDGTITTFAGGGQSLGDGGPATSALVVQPLDVAADAEGNVYIASGGGIRKVDTKGTITTITNGQGQSLGDGGPARSANLTAYGVAVDAQGKNLYIADRTHSSCARSRPRRQPRAAARPQRPRRRPARSRPF